MKIKKGDTVLLITGKDKGKKGKVLQSLPSKNKIVAENLNLRKKHVKPKKSGEKGQIIEFPTPFNVSNASLICPKCSKPSRIGYLIENGKKFRFCKKCKSKI